MNKEQKFFNKIEEILKSHQEEYIPGSWEEFSREKRKKRKTILLWRWTGAAAVLLLLAYSSFEFFSTETSQNKVQTISHSNHGIITKDTSITEGHEERSLLKLNKTTESYSLKQTRKKVSENEKPLLDIKTVKIFANDRISDSRLHPDIIGKIGANEGLAAIDTIIARSSPTEISVVSNPLANVSDHNSDKKVPTFTNLTNQDVIVTKEKEGKKFVYSLVLSPSMGNQKLNLGTGLDVSYHIDNNISLSGGIMYSSLSAEKNINDGGAGNKKLQDVELAISGFEVPIRLEYQTKDGFYLTAGLSGMSVTNDKLAYNYITQTTQIITEVSGGVSRETVKIVSQESTEQSPEKIRNYIGFYTFSAGTKKAFGSNNINVGPFIKIPFGSVSSEKIKLIQGGFRLSFDF